jgi:hypothetical protein
VFVAVGELGLFVVFAVGWAVGQRAPAWTVTLLGQGVLNGVVANRASEARMP